MERRIPSVKERANRAVGGSVVRTKKEEKQNFRVRFLHTTSRNYLILITYPPHPSWARWRGASSCNRCSSYPAVLESSVNEASRSHKRFCSDFLPGREEQACPDLDAELWIANGRAEMGGTTGPFPINPPQPEPGSHPVGFAVQPGRRRASKASSRQGHWRPPSRRR